MNQAEAFALPPELRYEDESGVRARRPAAAAPTIMSVAKMADRNARRRAWLAFSIAAGLAIGAVVTIIASLGGSETSIARPMLRRATQAQTAITVEMPGTSTVVMTSAPVKKPKTKGRRR